MLKPLLFALALAPSLSLAADVEQLIHCPEPELIVQTDVPGSFHSVLTAKSSEGFGFGFFGTVLVRPENLEYFGAELTEVNDYWRYACGYTASGVSVGLETRDDINYRDCHFADGTQECRGTLEDCVLICPKGNIEVQ